MVGVVVGMSGSTNPRLADNIGTKSATQGMFRRNPGKIRHDLALDQPPWPLTPPLVNPQKNLVCLTGSAGLNPLTSTPRGSTGTLIVVDHRA